MNIFDNYDHTKDEDFFPEEEEECPRCGEGCRDCRCSLDDIREHEFDLMDAIEEVRRNSWKYWLRLATRE